MQLTFIVLIVEFFILLLCFAGMVCVRLFRDYKEKQTKKRRAALKKLLAEAVVQKKVLSLNEVPRKLLHTTDLLSVIESFDRYFVDSIWQETKKHLVENYLGEKLIGYLSSSSWKKQQLALRCINLYPAQQAESIKILPLLNDKRFLIRILAAAALIHAEKKELLLAVLTKMIQEAPMARYAYRDLLMHSKISHFHWMEEIAAEEKDLNIVAALLDILSTKTHHNLLPLASLYIDSENLSCKLRAIQIFSKTPSEISQKQLIKVLQDKEETIRAAAAEGLGLLHAQNAIPALEHSLQDAQWSVRLKAAQALKSIGKEGLNILYGQTPGQHKEAYEAAKYILSMP